MLPLPATPLLDSILRPYRLFTGPWCCALCRLTSLPCPCVQSALDDFPATTKGKHSPFFKCRVSPPLLSLQSWPRHPVLPSRSSLGNSAGREDDGDPDDDEDERVRDFSHCFSSVRTPTPAGEQTFNLMLPYFPTASNITRHMIAISGCLSNESANEPVEVIGRTGLERVATLHVLEPGAGSRVPGRSPCPR